MTFNITHYIQQEYYLNNYISFIKPAKNTKKKIATLLFHKETESID